MKCKVCQVETPRRIRCGALVCEACKRFFMRQKRQHPNGEGIKCKHGKDKSCLKEDQGRGKLTQRGWLWRGMCAACRYKKCIKVGMQYRGKTTINVKESISSLTSSGKSAKNNNPLQMYLYWKILSLKKYLKKKMLLMLKKRRQMTTAG